jgi:uncharacterized protein (DUF1330 family)
MPAYVVLNVTVREPEAYDRYKQLAARSVAVYGGRYLVPAKALRQSCADTDMVLVEGVAG